MYFNKYVIFPKDERKYNIKVSDVAYKVAKLVKLVKKHSFFICKKEHEKNYLLIF